MLLSYLASGKVQDSGQASFGCAAAELGELALRRKLLLRPRKTRKKFGVEFYRYPRDIELLETGRTGLVWADALLAELEVHASEPEPVLLRQWLRRRRREALALHRETLTRRGLLLHRPTRLGRDRYYPCVVTRAALIDEIRACYIDQRRLDARLLLLCDLVEAAEMRDELSLRLTWRQWLGWSRRAGVVESVPEELRETSWMLRLMVPSRKGG
ncbi:hypothetical protein GCM10022384_31510 [Streptomyces marokkonensis]|uniref:Uncharacterized protein n=1 Tax=Streptomyces marokkonensis TaxID=324855 RepID=A0ABP7QBJ6_9ACTN